MKYYKIISILIMAVVSMTSLMPVFTAEPYNDPEIADEQDDVTGTLIERPNIFTILQGIGIIEFEKFALKTSE